jgi:hypothetical protein
MSSSNILTKNSTSNFFASNSTTVYEYSLTLINTIDHDIQDNLTAAFTHIPTLNDWQQWLSGWTDCGYKLQSQPQLLRTI